MKLLDHHLLRTPHEKNRNSGKLHTHTQTRTHTVLFRLGTNRQARHTLFYKEVLSCFPEWVFTTLTSNSNLMPLTCWRTFQPLTPCCHCASHPSCLCVRPHTLPASVSSPLEGWGAGADHHCSTYPKRWAGRGSFFKGDLFPAQLTHTWLQKSYHGFVISLLSLKG